MGIFFSAAFLTQLPCCCCCLKRTLQFLLAFSSACVLLPLHCTTPPRDQSWLVGTVIHLLFCLFNSINTLLILLIYLTEISCKCPCFYWNWSGLQMSATVEGNWFATYAQTMLVKRVISSCALTSCILCRRLKGLSVMQKMWVCMGEKVAKSSASQEKKNGWQLSVWQRLLRLLHQCF